MTEQQIAQRHTIIQHSREAAIAYTKGTTAGRDTAAHLFDLAIRWGHTPGHACAVVVRWVDSCPKMVNW